MRVLAVQVADSTYSNFVRFVAQNHLFVGNRFQARKRIPRTITHLSGKRVNQDLGLS